METTIAVPRHELLQIAEAVAREKGIERDEVLEAMEQAVQKAGRSKYGHEHDIRAFIDRKSGEIKLQRFREVADPVENEITQISPTDARRHGHEAKVGEFLIDDLPPIDFGRIAAQTAKQVIVQKVREAERKRQYDEYKGRKGEIVNGLVKRVEFGNVTVDLGKAEAMLRRDELLPRENFRNGDRVRAYIADVREEPRGPQIFLSRTHPQFMAKLFAQEVPEIYDGIIEIKAVARDPGSRVQAVVGELQGEKIDIIPWSMQPANFIVNALQPAEVAKVVLDEDAERIEVVVPDDQLSLAIGRRGQNVRLASQLTGWDIDILTEQEESERRQKEFTERSALFMEALDVDEMVGQVLASEGFTSVEEVAYVDAGEIASIDGFDDDTANEIQSRARDYLDRIEAEHDAARKELGVADELRDLPGVTTAMMVALGKDGVKTIEDFAGYAVDDLVGWKERKDGETKTFEGVLGEFGVSRADAEQMVLAARLAAGWITEEQLAAQSADEDAEAVA